MQVRALVNDAFRPELVPAPSLEARAYHAALPGYRPTPLRELAVLARELGVARVALKDESDRLGLPAFKILGASWAVEQAVRSRPGIEVLVAASAGNHGRAVAHAAALRGLRCHIFLPARSVAARRAAIASEGAEVTVVDGSYEDALVLSAVAAAAPDAIEIADVGTSETATWVVDGYATLFAELAAEGDFDLILVPAGVGSLAAAAARFAAARRTPVVAVEPETAACLTASLRQGAPAIVATPGTTMAGLDCAEISAAAWPWLRDGIAGTVLVDDRETHAAMRELAREGLAIGDCGAAPVAALRALLTDDDCAGLRDRLHVSPETRVALIATEGPTDPEGYAAVVSGATG
ncbi:MAG TPA: pyridoxal-phosphate dependent enzyme [Acidimicrobiales bacterium]|nr:pyridoxal-phosphate dependent enzyme [Acidimicrobiales bacterium]